MKQNLFRSFIIGLLALFGVCGVVYAITLTPKELLDLQNNNSIGSGGVLVDSPPANINSNLYPTTDNAYDVGSVVNSWRNGVFDGTLTAGTLTATTANLGTLTATIALNTDEPLTIGNGSVSSTINGSSTSTFPYGATFATTGGNVGIGAASPPAKLTVQGAGATFIAPSAGVRLFVGGVVTAGDINGMSIQGGSGVGTGSFINLGTYTVDASSQIQYHPYGNNIGQLDFSLLGVDKFSITPAGASSTQQFSALGPVWIGGTATTTIRGGDPGLATSTFEGDVSISNLYSGQLVLPTDSGWSSLIDIGVSGSAATTTQQGYSFDVDGNAILKIFGSSDALGGIYNPRVSMTNNIGTATTTLQQPSANATTTFYWAAKNATTKGVGTCMVFTGSDGTRYYLSATTTGAAQFTTVSCENTGIGLTRD